MTDIKVPTFPESVEDGAIATWHKQVGDSFNRDELLVEIETDKVILEVPAPQDGTLTKITAKVGDIVKTQQVIGAFGPLKQSKATAAVKEASNESKKAPVNTKGESTTGKSRGVKAGPAARRLASEKGVNLNDVAGKGDMITKEDVMSWAANDGSTGGTSGNQTTAERLEKRVPMTRLRQSIANRLVESQQTSASLTTFNEVNMQPVMDLRSKYKDAFAEKHQGARLGFMSFFAKAA
ncbi:MAG: 2-oxo acid dehydrogenase subunit E2, partial [Gammaproteobacteria bacterium]|nr:2-oxo acid dehydrogenase subunit E2 [Gammaproteobacteria bacterium]